MPHVLVPNRRSVTPAFLAIDRDLRIRSWSRGAESLLGWAADEALGRSAVELLCGGRRESGLGDTLRRWEPCTYEGTQRRKDGSELAVSCSFEPQQRGPVSEQAMLVIEPIDAAAAELDARNASVISSMREGVVVQAADGSILSCNAAAERILGLSADQLRGRTSTDPRWRSVYEDGTPMPGAEHPSMVALRTGKSVSGAVMGVHKPTGELTWISIHSVVVDSPDPAERVVVTTFADITEAREQAARLRHQAQQLQFVFEGSNDGFWDWHVPSGRVEFSPRWAAMLGYTVQEIEPHVSSWAKLVHPDDMPLVEAALRPHLRGETPFYEVEHRVRAKDGRWVWILDRGKVVERDAMGQPVRMCGTHTDVTVRREFDERLRAALRDNEKLVAELREALANVQQLRGLLPVCAWCKSVRNDAGYWQQIEHYLSEHTQARFTHGLCPTCSGKLERS